MKITDKELLKLIWINQLRLLSKYVIKNYSNGGHSVVDDSDSSYGWASNESRGSRIRVTQKISKGHLWVRIKNLAKDGKLKTGYDLKAYEAFAQFRIENEKSREAFSASRKFWLDKGVPTGWSTSPDGRACANTTKDVDIELLRPECEKILIEKFGDHYLPFKYITELRCDVCDAFIGLKGEEDEIDFLEYTTSCPEFETDCPVGRGECYEKKVIYNG